MARGRIELPTRGFSVVACTAALGRHQPASDTRRYHISTSAADTGGRCAGIVCHRLGLRGTVGGQRLNGAGARARPPRAVRSGSRAAR